MPKSFKSILSSGLIVVSLVMISYKALSKEGKEMREPMFKAGDCLDTWKQTEIDPDVEAWQKVPLAARYKVNEVGKKSYSLKELHPGISWTYKFEEVHKNMVKVKCED